MATFRIPLSAPNITEADVAEVLACLTSGWVSTASPWVPRFEAQFVAQLASPQPQQALAVQSGTLALALALRAAGVRPGDDVLTPALTFVATANAVCHVGARPVFVDVCPHTLAMAPAQLAAAWTPKTQAVVVTHLYGIPAPVAALRAALPRPVPIIEDASEALGATNTQGLAVGTLADAGCFSFNGNKLITTGGGGMVVAPQAAWVEALRHYVHQARVPGTTEFIHDDVGINGRMTGLAASLGLAQLARLPAVLAVKRGINRVYSVGLETVAGVARVSEVVFETGESACWLSLVWLETPELREAVLTGLLARGIEARPLFYPLPLLPAFASTGQQASCPVATDLWQRGLCLPSSVSLNASAQDEVMATIQEVMAKTGAAG